MTTTVIQAGQISQPQPIAPGVLVTVTPGNGASAFVEYTTGSSIDLANGTATWASWPRGTVSGVAAALSNKLGFVRVTATGGAVVLDTNYTPTNQQLGPFATDWSGQKALSVLAQSGVAASVTGTTTPTVLAAITVPAGALGPNGCLRVTTQWSYTNNANNKTLGITLGGTSFMASIQSTTNGLQYQTNIRNRGAQNSQVGYGATAGGSFTATGVVPTTGAVDTTQSQVLNLTATLGTSTDTATLEGYTVEILNP